MTIFDHFRTLSTDEFFLSGIDLLENGAIPENERRGFTEKLIKSVYPAAPQDYRISKNNFWFRMVWEKCAWKGLFDATRRESAERWMDDQRKYNKGVWPPVARFERVVYLPQPNKYREV